MTRRIASFPARLRRTLLLRGVTIWLLARLVGMAALSSGSTTEAAALLLPAWTLVMTACLMLVDLHRRHELTLFQNLGVATFHAVLVATSPAIVLEIVLVMLPA